jgi:ElaB/YqjD/DUF883 family membrane-anchored ribosome-binding protein
MNTHRAAAMASSLAGDLQKSVGDIADGAKRQAGATAHQASAAAEEIYGEVRQGANDAAVAVGGTVQARPLAALMLAGVVGGLLGALMARR